MKSMKAVSVKPKRDATVPVLNPGEYCILNDLVHCRAPDGTIFCCTMSGGSFRPDPEIIRNRDGTLTIMTMPWGSNVGEGGYRPWEGKMVKDVWTWNASEY